ncbi:MAG TPA: imidazole glycerol phosphate synthase subunit HisH [Chryseolinea sp.]|nr:imidazole glycerol phosphate synthase subunit HisH [Chryseolinea sp.]
MVQIINYGLGNLGSVQNMLKRINVNSTIVKNPKDLRAEKIILPGVGSFDTGMSNLLNDGWVEVLNENVLKHKVPTLGICLGMQLMTNRSDEGQLGGLGWIEGEVLKFPVNTLKTPHMGWNIVRPAGLDASILTSDKPELRFYFVHSYFVKVDNSSDRLGTTNYGSEFTSAFRRNNVYGVQFHPEKSHKFGMMVFKNFASL